MRLPEPAQGVRPFTIMPKKGAKTPDYAVDDRIKCQICGREFQRIDRRHLKHHDITPDEYRAEFGVAFLTCKALRAKLSGHYRKKPKTPYQPLEREEILKALRLYAKRHRPLTYVWLKENDPGLLKQTERIAPTWAEALDAAGLNGRKIEVRTHWDQAKLAADLREWISRNGALNAARLKASEVRLHAAVAARYGGFQNAARELRLPYAASIQKWSAERIVQEIKRLNHRRANLQPTVVARKHPKLFHAALRHAGSWADALELAGINASRHLAHRNWLPGQVEDELRDWAVRHGHLNDSDLRKHNCPLARAVQRKYGTIKKAARRLALPYRPSRQSISKEDVVSRIRLRAQHAKDLQACVVAREDGPLHGAAMRHYGSWSKALRAANIGFDPVAEKRKQAERTLLSELKRHIRQHGKLVPSVLRTTDPRLYHRATGRYGSIRNAADSLSLPFKSLRKSHSRESIVRGIRERQKAGKPLQARRVEEDDPALHSAVYRHFGSWSAMLRKVGVRGVRDYG